MWKSLFNANFSFSFLRVELEATSRCLRAQELRESKEITVGGIHSNGEDNSGSLKICELGVWAN